MFYSARRRGAFVYATWSARNMASKAMRTAAVVAAIATFVVFGAAAVATVAADDRAPSESPRLRDLIDREVDAAHQAEKIAPAGPADDAEFLRRVYLDLVGVIPSYDETTTFVRETDSEKRSRWIDKLLDDPRYARRQASQWDLTFFGRKPNDQELTNRREAFQEWLRDKFASNQPYDRWVRELLLARGGTYEQGPAMFFAQFRSRPEDAAEAVSKIFLGTQIHCARCHDHPFDKWSQTDFYGVAGFFVRLTFVDANEGGKRHYILAEKSSGEVLFTGPASQLKPGQKGEPVAARFLDGAPLDEPPLPKDFKEPDLKGNKKPPAPLFSRQEKFADWVARPENPYFTRAAINRIWAQFLGRGLVDPVDDLRENQPASLPVLFQTIQDQWIARRYDMKWLIRELVNSRTYQRSSAGPGADASPIWYERARVRPLSAEELIDSFRLATGFDDAVRAAGGKPETTAMPERNYFLSSFGEPLNGRGEFQPGLNEHLFLNNSGTLRQSLLQPKKGNLADGLLQSTAPWDDRVDRLFLTVLSRPPSSAEREKFVAYLTADKASAAAVEEAIWVLLNTSEFRFNH